MGAHYLIRPGRPADAAALGRLERQCFSDPWSEAAFVEALQGDELLTLVAAPPSAEADTTPVGYLVARRVLDGAEILNLAVAPARRGAGLGGRLLARALGELGGAGVREVFLEVRESNTAAQALYRARGFAVVGRRRGYYRGPEEDALVLRCPLPAPA